MSVRSLFNAFAGRILYLWVKSDSMHIPDAGDSSACRNTVFVVEYRSWSNLLVLDHECRNQHLPSPFSKLPAPFLKAWHGVYTVAPKMPFRVWLRRQPKRSTMLMGMLARLKQHPEEDIRLVPVGIFWGRPVAKQRHWLAVLFAESWRIAGRIRKFFAIAIHGRHTLVKFSEPVSFRASIDHHKTDAENLDAMQALLVHRLHELRTATLGPDISHRRTLINDLMHNTDVRLAVKARQESDRLSDYRAAVLARRYLYEIVADCTTVTIQILQRVLTAFWNKFYAGIAIYHCDELKRLALTHSIVYVPCHRSHIDYLLLSYVIHQQGLAIPYIAAGKNLNLPIIGSILRGAGAFFIRRSFKGNRLYATLLFEYMAKLIGKGIPIEYFIEGGRSRTGRLLKPKPGMLAMTVRGFLKYRGKPLVFIPVHIGYEKMIEGKAYVAELLGSKKKKESLSSALKSMVNIRGEYGQVTTNFGEPVFLSRLLDENHAPWADDVFHDDDRPPWLTRTVSQLADAIMIEINRAASVNATNLVSVVVVASPGGYVDAQEMADQITLYAGLIGHMRYANRLVVTPLSGQEQIDRVESLGLVKRRRHPFGDIIYAEKRSIAALNYYRNNILHLLALPSLLACAFVGKQSLSREKLYPVVRRAYPFLRSELFLHWEPSQLTSAVDRVLDFFESHGLVHRKASGDNYYRPGVGTMAYGRLIQLAQVLLPVLELYLMVSAILTRHQDKNMNQRELQELCYQAAQRFSILHRQSSIDYFDKHLLTHFINNLVTQGMLAVVEDTLQVNASLSGFAKDLRILLGSQIRTSMLRLLKNNA